MRWLSSAPTRVMQAGQEPAVEARVLERELGLGVARRCRARRRPRRAAPARHARAPGPRRAASAATARSSPRGAGAGFGDGLRVQAAGVLVEARDQVGPRAQRSKEAR